MASELITLPIRLGVRAATLALRGGEELASRALALASTLVDGSEREPAPRAPAPPRAHRALRFPTAARRSISTHHPFRGRPTSPRTPPSLRSSPSRAPRTVPAPKSASPSRGPATASSAPRTSSSGWPSQTPRSSPPSSSSKAPTNGVKPCCRQCTERSSSQRAAADELENQKGRSRCPAPSP